MPKALSHIALIVAHPTRTADLLTGVFPDARIVRGEDPQDAHPEVIVELGGLEFALIRGNGPASRNGDHIAFAVSKEEQFGLCRTHGRVGAGLSDGERRHGVVFQRLRQPCV